MTNAPISLLAAFEELRDPRARECAYQLDELLLAAICSVISGAESWTTIVEWSELKLDWLLAFDSHLHPVDRRLARPTEIVNVVATRPGSQAESRERIYVVSGHYDSRNSDAADAVNDAPGANDDASGSAAVIELACVMARYQFDATLVFMTVAAEEQGLYGATDYAEKAKQKKLDIAGMFTNDIIGSSVDEDGKRDNGQVRLFAEGIPALKDMPEQLRALIQTGGENDSLPRQLARHVKEIGERYVDGFKVTVVTRRDRYLRGGDHAPFLDPSWLKPDRYRCRRGPSGAS